MSDIARLTKQIVAFRNARKWKQFHNPKDLSLSLMLEAAEVAEHFQWKSPEEMLAHVKKHKAEVGDELVDTMYWVLLLAHDLKIDLVKQFERKMKQNAVKYPVKKSRGKHTKYTEL